MNEVIDISPEVRAAMAGYLPRVPLLVQLARRLEELAQERLGSVDHVDRVYFRSKAPISFARKSLQRDKETGGLKYERPLEDVEDQVAGRVLVFFRSDIDVVVGQLRGLFNRVEQKRKAPQMHDAFAYESEHLVCIIPPQAHPPGWTSLIDPPTTFELQVRTLFMHAWAEPEHDIRYKAKTALTEEENRKLAWAASSAWGGDEIFEQVRASIAGRTS